MVVNSSPVITCSPEQQQQVQIGRSHHPCRPAQLHPLPPLSACPGMPLLQQHTEPLTSQLEASDRVSSTFKMRNAQALRVSCHQVEWNQGHFSFCSRDSCLYNRIEPTKALRILLTLVALAGGKIAAARPLPARPPPPAAGAPPAHIPVAIWLIAAAGANYQACWQHIA